MRPIMPRTTSVGSAPMALGQARFVRSQHLLLVAGGARAPDPPREPAAVAGRAGAVGAIPIAEPHDLEALADERGEALRREDGRLVGGRVARAAPPAGR